jgi:hypothetical protein
MEAEWKQREAERSRELMFTGREKKEIREMSRAEVKSGRREFLWSREHEGGYQRKQRAGKRYGGGGKLSLEIEGGPRAQSRHTESNKEKREQSRQQANRHKEQRVMCCVAGQDRVSHACGPREGRASAERRS